MFKKIKGQDRVIDLLKMAIKQDRIASSYLFYGPEGVGKFTTALYFGMALNCLASIESRPCGVCNSCKKFLKFSHPDFVYIFPTPNMKITANGEIESNKLLKEYQEYVINKIESPWKEFFFSQNVQIRIDNILMLEHHINLSTHESKYKIYIIENADQINVNAANAFLKTLEEPPDNSVIILTTSKVNSLLPTILSRCQKISFSYINRHDIEILLEKTTYISPIDAKMFSRISNGNVEKALRLANEGSTISRDEAIKLIKIFLQANDYAFLEYLGNYSSSKNRKLLSEIISHLIIWLSDLIYFLYEPEQIVNLDHTDILEELYHKNPYVNDYVNETISFFEIMQKKLDGFVNPQLILTGVYNRLKKIYA
ncbi:MAG: DNA polymerase III subunit [Candidatus Cloacimonetes bacterium]|nr:DNA polymerase III subunit [Candidatus Cloacimonadota bacterium]